MPFPEDGMDSTPESLFDEMKNSKKDQDDIEFIMMTLMIPPDVIRDLLGDGILDMEDLTSMLDQYEESIDKEIKKESPEYTGEDKDHPNYGNRFSDWDFELDGEDYT